MQPDNSKNEKPQLNNEEDIEVVQAIDEQHTSIHNRQVWLEWHRDQIIGREDPDAASWKRQSN